METPLERSTRSSSTLYSSDLTLIVIADVAADLGPLLMAEEGAAEKIEGKAVKDSQTIGRPIKMVARTPKCNGAFIVGILTAD